MEIKSNTLVFKLLLYPSINNKYLVSIYIDIF